MKTKLYFFLLFLLFSFSSISFPQTELKKKIASMVMVGFNGTSLPDSLIYDISNRGLGSVILFARNVTSPPQLKQLTTQLQSYASVPLLIAIDQEGGRIARLGQNNGYEKTESAYTLGSIINSLDTTAFWSLKMANWLLDGGINVNFAPVVDVNVNPLSPAIGALDRSFSAIPDSVYIHAEKFISMFNSKKILCTLKHFPGHGSAVNDSHLGFTDISTTWADSELVPYRKLIQNNYSDLIMSGHLFNSNIDSLYPASLSYNTLTGLLRNQLGFQGAIVTDGLFMQAISDNFSFEKTVELAINAGNDLLLYTTNILNGHSLLDSVVNIVVNKINMGIISEARIEESYQRIMQLRQRLLADVPDNGMSQVINNYELTNFPNPFNPATQIKCTIAKPGLYELTVFNVLGEQIAIIQNGFLTAGVHSFSFNSNGLASGIYFYKLSGQNVCLIKKMVVLK